MTDAQPAAEPQGVSAELTIARLRWAERYLREQGRGDYADGVHAALAALDAQALLKEVAVCGSVPDEEDFGHEDCDCCEPARAASALRKALGPDLWTRIQEATHG